MSATTVKEMLTVEETVKVLVAFYKDCVGFWKREGKTDSVAKQMALQDIESLNTNPFEPNGDWLNQEAKHYFVEYIENL